MKTVAVIFGGKSTEHDVSIVTAISSIIRPLELSGKFKVEPVYISKDGSWYWDAKLSDIKVFQSGEIDDVLRKSAKVHLLFDDGLTLVKSSQFAGRKMYRKIDVVFPAMHGTHGEDGELMGLLQMANLPFVGCDMVSSAIAMDKVLAKQVAKANNEEIEVGKYEYLTSKVFSEKPSEVVNGIEKSLSYPLFVKPAHLGSSIGISRVTDRDGLINALEVATHYDDKVIVEEEVKNLVEVTLPIMGNEDLKPAFLEQPLLKTEDFFDFETKYMQGGKGKGKGGESGAQGYSKIPAELPKALYDKAVETGLAVYRALGCSGIARVDMLVDTKAKRVQFNEVNPLPGGLYAHNWRRKGLSNVGLVEDLVQLAEERFASRERINTAFSTNYLKQF